MYTKRKYGFWMTFNWSKMPFLYGLLLALIVHFAWHFTEIDFSLPWQPIGVIGIAVAFYLGFKNSYSNSTQAKRAFTGIEKPGLF